MCLSFLRNSLALFHSRTHSLADSLARSRCLLFRLCVPFSKFLSPKLLCVCVVKSFEIPWLFICSFSLFCFASCHICKCVSVFSCCVFVYLYKNLFKDVLSMSCFFVLYTKWVSQRTLCEYPQQFSSSLAAYLCLLLAHSAVILRPELFFFAVYLFVLSLSYIYVHIICILICLLLLLFGFSTHAHACTHRHTFTIALRWRVVDVIFDRTYSKVVTEFARKKNLPI